jgi:predicted ribosomally synthesized peptide with SipW-like signal peptide
MLLAGGTWALWYDSERVPGHTVMAGNLDIHGPAYGQGYMWDISNIRGTNNAKHTKFVRDAQDVYRDDADVLADDDSLTIECLAQDETDSNYADTEGHLIDPDKDPAASAPGPWRATPGDTFLYVAPYFVALDGDNMVANLTITRDEKVLDSDYQAIIDFSAKALIHTIDGWVQVDLEDNARKWLENAKSYSVTLQAENEMAGADDPIGIVTDPGDPGATPPIPPTYNGMFIELDAIPEGADYTAARGTENVCIVVEATMNPKIMNRDYTLGKTGNDALAAFRGMTVSLEQTRQAGLGNF